MARIVSVKALEILDSRGNPTLQVSIQTDVGHISRACVPSGASTGENEALELRDNDPCRYNKKGVQIACSHVEGPISDILIGEHVFDQEKLDRLMAADGTLNKSRFGANAILGASLALARAGADAAGLPLYRYIGGSYCSILPVPMMNIINGGLHGDNGIDFQEFMIRPINAPSFKEALRYGVEIFHALKKILKGKGLSTAVGDEGGFAPPLKSAEEALDLILEAISLAGFSPGKEISLALDCAASAFFDKTTSSYKNKSTEEQIAYLESLVNRYPIDSIEDGLDENDWTGWKRLTEKLGNKIQIVGDDLFVTNPKFIRRGIREKSANALLVKLNQIGTLTETLEAVQIAKSAGYKIIISHRSGETEDPFIADLAVATQSGQIKTGSLSRSDRICKYNRLLQIEEDLKGISQYGFSAIMKG